MQNLFCLLVWVSVAPNIKITQLRYETKINIYYNVQL